MPEDKMDVSVNVGRLDAADLYTEVKAVAAML
jgi:hypothetical protein